MSSQAATGSPPSSGSFWDGFKNKILSFISGPDSKRRAQWNPEIEMKFLRLLGYLKSMKGSEPKLAHEVLADLLPILELDTFHYGGLENASREANDIFNHVRGLLLELWSYLLFTLPHISLNDTTTFYKAITLLMRRREFDTHYLALDPKSLAPRTNYEQNIVIAREYRNLLFATHSFLLNKLDTLASSGAVRPYALLVFGSKVLALSYFRLPFISSEIIRTLQSVPQPVPPASPSLPSDPASSPDRYDPSDEPIPSALLDPNEISRSIANPALSHSLLSTELPAFPSDTSAMPSIPPEELETLETLPQEVEQVTDDFAADPFSPQGQPAEDAEDAVEDPDAPTGDGNRQPSAEEEAKGGAEGEHASATRNASAFPLPPGLYSASPVLVDEDPLLDHPSPPSSSSQDPSTPPHPSSSSSSSTPPRSPSGKGGLSANGFPAPASQQSRSALSRLVVVMNEESVADDTSDESSDYAGSTFLMLEWMNYHEALRRIKFDGMEEKLKRLPKTWLAQIGQRDLLFYMLGKALVAYVQDTCETFPTAEQWSSIYGWELFKNEANYLFSINTAPSRPETEFFSFVMLTDPSIISSYMRMSLSRTNSFNIPATIEVFSTFETWIRLLDQHHLRLTAEFDGPFFCKAIDIAFQFDHHQALVRILSILFYFAHMFPHQLRREVFGELLLKKYFFILFLHWDVSVRNTFHQILVFKMLRATRSHLRGEGLKISELGSSTSTQTPPQIIPLARSIVEDDEDTTDRILWAKIEAYVSMTQDQLRNPELGHFPRSSFIYVPRALVEYKMYLSLYFIREADLATKPPRLLPITLAKLCLENREGAQQASAVLDARTPSPSSSSSSSSSPSSSLEPKAKQKKRASLKDRIKKRTHSTPERKSSHRGKSRNDHTL